LLVIDDDIEDLEIFLKALEETGATVEATTARDGIEALKILQENNLQPQMIFLDMNMPRMGGEECLAHIRQIKQLESVPVVIYTTSSYPGEKERLLGIGASDYLTKEYSFRSIIDQLTILFDKYIPQCLPTTPHH
jgi:CheY-like chemotaxis protein